MPPRPWLQLELPPYIYTAVQFPVRRIFSWRARPSVVEHLKGHTHKLDWTSMCLLHKLNPLRQTIKLIFFLEPPGNISELGFHSPRPVSGRATEWNLTPRCGKQCGIRKMTLCSFGNWFPGVGNTTESETDPPVWEIWQYRNLIPRCRKHCRIRIWFPGVGKHCRIRICLNGVEKKPLQNRNLTPRFGEDCMMKILLQYRIKA